MNDYRTCILAWFGDDTAASLLFCVLRRQRLYFLPHPTAPRGVCSMPTLLCQDAHAHAHFLAGFQLIFAAVAVWWLRGRFSSVIHSRSDFAMHTFMKISRSHSDFLTNRFFLWWFLFVCLFVLGFLSLRFKRKIHYSNILSMSG